MDVLHFGKYIISRNIVYKYPLSKYWFWCAYDPRSSQYSRYWLTQESFIIIVVGYFDMSQGVG